MNNKGKAAGKSILGLIFLAVFIGFYFVSAIINLVHISNSQKLASDSAKAPQKGDYVDAEYHIGSGQLLEVKHSISHIIPTGKEYYYLVCNDNSDYAIFVRAGKDFGDNFKDNYSEEAVKVKGKVREMDHDVHNELFSIAKEFTASNIKVPSGSNKLVYIDTLTGTQSILRILAPVLFLIGAVIIVVSAKSKVNSPVEVQPKAPGIVALVLIIGSICLMIYTLSYM